MNSIRSKIIIGFSWIVFIFALLILSIFVININLSNGYKKINNNVIYEQSLRDDIQSLIEISYNSFNTKDYSLYYKKLENIKNTESSLDLIFASDSNVNKETILAYRSLKNSLNIVINEIENNKLALEKNGSIVGVSKSIQDTFAKFEFVKQNITNLLILETKNIVLVTQETDKYQNSFIFYITITITIIIIIVIIFIVIFSRKITKPITYLSEISKKISAGDLNTPIDEKIIKEKDEIGYLADSFNLMIVKLREKINDFNISNKKLLQSNLDLQDAQKATINILEDTEESKNKAEELSFIIHDAYESITSQSLEGIILSWNHGAENLYGYLSEEMVGNSVNIIIPEEKDEEINYIKNAIITETKIEHFQTIRKRKDGSLVDVSISASPIKNSSNKLIGISVVTLNITKEKEVDKAKTEFVSLASHQLRTPLSAINWYTEMLLDGDAGAINDEQKKYLEEIAIGNKRMVDLVDDLLNVSRLDMGTFVLETKSINILELLKSVLGEIKSQILEKKLSIEELYGQDIPLFTADEKLMRMIFQNLLSNAVKYTPPLGLVKISLLKLNKGENFGEKIIDKESLAFSVSDSGIGIPSNQQDKIFQKLFRADNAKESETEGTGLGLYVIKSIIDLSGGLIWFKSEENKETTFWVVFPIDGMKEKVKQVV